MTKPCTLVILAKQPLPGVVKTRLIPTLGAAGAARLAERMLRHALAEALRAAEVVPSLGVELCVAPEAGDPYWAALAGNRPLTISQQVAGDIGERMLAAVTRITARGEYAILMGADCPGLTASRIAEAIASLRAPGVDLVITPARDGGYVLIGMGETHGTLFRDMPWSTPRVMALTLGRARAKGLECVCPDTLDDIDETEDLAVLPPEFGLGGISLSPRGEATRR